MQTYIGTKIVMAEPCERWEEGGDVKAAVPGYKVIYPDGYESWSPKDVFEKAYLKVVANPDLKTNAPSISQQMVDDFIAAVEVQTMGIKTTVVQAMLKNGFEIVEASGCVSAENYDEEMGASICLEKIKDKVWMLLGFLLQTAVNGVNAKEFRCENMKNPDKGLNFGQALEAAKRGKRIARAGWNGKGQYVELGKNIYYKHEDEPTLMACHDDIGSQALVFCGTRGRQVGWLASQSDMLAEDWMVIG